MDGFCVMSLEIIGYYHEALDINSLALLNNPQTLIRVKNFFKILDKNKYMNTMFMMIKIIIYAIVLVVMYFTVHIQNYTCTNLSSFCMS